MRQVVLDTETTGLETEQGHRIIEIGCIELMNRRRTNRSFHRFLHPDRDIDGGAEEVHGISREMLANQPRFREIAGELLDFLRGAELVIHNADFDVGFLNHEFALAGLAGDTVQQNCRLLDTLALARRLHPGQRNSLDALCKRYGVDNSGREQHGALLDAELLAEVYLAMTGGQATLSLDSTPAAGAARVPATRVVREGLEFRVLRASAEELTAHEKQLELIDKACPEGALWRRFGS
jgi:DNA polymerase-3 subunit epsilon